ncbi:MAG TPA: NADH-quinone oxidoreductase subunit L [Candidatus Omnitrophota bacterium]|jgi:NADH-quinone oxidoreductase subunit L|nr:MAG: NADH-quinone oxidoreductase subunit L [Candidatus Omnitrophica bacterium ADurb.Bin314]HOE68175.1 NADH-quinone oxidoreductase subunit L [Candidatus Omnitrophota bacterium]HQB93966.1 NADH-quinone oxidoreductase subunit L [Candidatus Omnitrophota bacterium]
MNPDMIYLVPLLPFTAFVVNILLGARFLKHRASWLSIATSAAACAIALPICFAVFKGGHFAGEFSWLPVGGGTLRFGYLIDPLSASLLFMVTIVGTLIQIYASGYMAGDPRYSRFFAYVSLFMAAMLTLVISNNFILFFMAWEIMGLCSYLLIGFYFERESAAKACFKAFLTTRVGDVGFLIGMLTLFTALGTLNFSEINGALAHGSARAAVPASLLVMSALFMFCGTVGKSAQFPLHVWLPDAMEGPTPVSALIHAATMVAAGVFLVARAFVIFMAVPETMPVVTAIGCFTAFMAAFIALTQTDIKRILAYSTISQLGYMVTALGMQGLGAGTFHLITHAFFKALLFLGAGSVIHGTHVQDIRQMGGLFRKMPHTAITFIIASLALAGIPPLSGFWSKDEILLTAFASGNIVVFWVLTLSAFMTAFYMFRLVFMTFFGKARDPHVHAHESPAVMTLPLWCLAIGSVVLGFPGSPFMHHWFQRFLAHAVPHPEYHPSAFVMSCSVIAAVSGIALAGIIYLKNVHWAEAVAKAFRPLYQLSLNKFYVDEIYSRFVIRPFLALGRVLFHFDATVIDGAVNGAGTGSMWLGAVKNWFDKNIVDGLVNFVGAFTCFLNSVVKRLQTGLVQNYLLIAFLGFLVFIIRELKLI